MTRRSLVVGSVAALLLVVVGTTLVIRRTHQPAEDIISTGPTIPLVNAASLQALPHKSASTADLSHLASSLVPPTNTWFSGMVLQKTPNVVYPMPLSFLAKDNGFEIGLPTVASTATAITGEHVPGMAADLGATGFQLTRYDKVSATLTYHGTSGTIGQAVITEGSPFVFYTATKAGVMTLSGINPADILERSSHYIRYTRSGHTYVVSTKAGTLTLSGGVVSATVQAGAVTTLYALPSPTDALKSYADTAVQSVAVSHSQTTTNVNTVFNYKTTTGKATAFAAMPYTAISGTRITSYESIYGPMPVYAGTSFKTTAAIVTPANTLDISKLSTDQKNQLIASLPADVAATKIDQQDSYYAGKQLARAANLLSIAEQLQQSASIDKLRTTVRDGFAKRLGAGYFYYDTGLHGVAATTKGFGSEDFNDHHFHYGYWLYAGSVLARYDTGFVSQYKDQLNLLAADIASYQVSNQFPLTRTYDPYAGHSWAAGLSPFADGNNQESSSEAINAWNGVALWGAATKNQALEQTGTWMLANETNTAQKAWRSVDTSDTAISNYSSPVASLNFGGKRTYSTFFSDQAAAKLGIQLIPMNPEQVSFQNDAAASKVISATIQHDNYNVPLGDYILMYLALRDPAKASILSAKQTTIDDGNSKTYLQAWIFSQSAR
jgi:endo-1,3(4)-beta-glucanase